MIEEIGVFRATCINTQPISRKITKNRTVVIHADELMEGKEYEFYKKTKILSTWYYHHRELGPFFAERFQ